MTGRRDWTPAEDAELRRLRALKQDWHQIAAALVGRTPSACSSRANKIFIPAQQERITAWRRDKLRTWRDARSVPVDHRRDAAD